MKELKPATLSKLRIKIIKQFLNDDYIKKRFVVLGDKLYEIRKNHLTYICIEDCYEYLITNYADILIKYIPKKYDVDMMLNFIFNERHQKIKSTLYMLKQLSLDETVLTPFLYASDYENGLSLHRLNFDDVDYINARADMEYGSDLFNLMKYIDLHINKKEDKIYIFTINDLEEFQRIVSLFTNDFIDVKKDLSRTYSFVKIYNSFRKPETKRKYILLFRKKPVRINFRAWMDNVAYHEIDVYKLNFAGIDVDYFTNIYTSYKIINNSYDIRR